MCMYVCMYGWMDGCMDACVNVYGCVWVATFHLQIIKLYLHIIKLLINNVLVE
jgi:hypothetical protein